MRLTILALVVLLPATASAQLRGGRGGGNGGARPQIQHPQAQRPSFSPPAVQKPAQRPNVPVPQARPNLPSVKPGIVPQQRPNLPNQGIQRPTTLPGNHPNLPNTGITKPGGGIGVRPDRPNLPNLPDNRPNLPDTRPNLPNRPNLPDTRPNLPDNRPNLPDRPNIGVLPNRPNIDINNRPDWANKPNINTGSFNNNTFNKINNNSIHANNFNTFAPTIYRPNQPYGGYFRPYAGGAYRPYGWANYGSGYTWGNYYTARYYHGWNGGYWNCFHFPPAFVPRPVPLGWLLPATAVWNYSNPYYTPVPTTVQYLNYSQPLPAPVQPAAPAPTDTPLSYSVPETAPQEDEAGKAAATIFDTARTEFAKGNSAAAEKTIDTAIAKLPQDPTLHEFRALTLFAQGKYQESAAAIYAVLAAGPGWDSDTLYGFYHDKLTYAKQLATLEAFAAANPTAAFAQFLLGYEYLVLNDTTKAIAAFENATKIDPKDELSAFLVKNLKSPLTETKP